MTLFRAARFEHLPTAMRTGTGRNGAVFLLLAWAGWVASAMPAQAATITRFADHVPGQFLVKLRAPKASLSAQSVAISSLVKDLAVKLGKNPVLSVKPLLTDKSIQVIRLSKTSEQDFKTAIDAIKGNPQIFYAEPNYILHALDDGVPNDPEFLKGWGLRNTGQRDPSGNIGLMGSDIDILPLWKAGFTGSRKIIVAVIDTGIDWNHPDLRANLYTNRGEIPGNGLDNDHNGFVQDIHGWNFLNNNNNSMDDHNHGTHCAGTIGAVGNNGIGVAGINWNVSLMPIKFLAADGSGSMDRAVDAINYATMMKVNVMSNSWGGGGFSQTMHDAIARARDAGILFVVAAGNDGHDNDEQSSYPASLDIDNILSVAALDNRDRLGLFSNYGARTVQVAAPGVHIWSTLRNGEYGSMSGTSMAAPFAAGIAALIESAHPKLTYAEVKERMIKTSTPVSALRTKILAQGRLNAYNAMHDLIPPRSEPAPQDPAPVDPAEPPVPGPQVWNREDYPIESDHPYENDLDVRYEIDAPGAQMIRVHFVRIDLEAGYNHLSIEDSSGNPVEDITGQRLDYTSASAPGERAYIHLRTDDSSVGYGFQVDKIEVIE